MCRQVDNLQKEKDCLLSNTTAFLQSQTDQHKAAAPTSTNSLKSLGIPFSQLSNILDILWGLGNPHAAYTVAHNILMNLQSKNRYCIVSFSWQKQHCWFPCQFRLTRLSFVRMTPLLRYHKKILIFSGLFSFQSFLFRFGVSWWINPIMWGILMD